MAKAAERANALDGEMVKSYLGRIEELNKQIGIVKGESGKTIAGHLSDINDILTEAKAHGVPKKSLRAHIRIRKNERSNIRIREELDENDAEIFNQIDEIIGDDFEALREEVLKALRQGD